MRNFRFLICATLLGVSAWAQAGEFTAKVIAVLDGDTILVMRGAAPVKLRLAEIDAPEKAQPYGGASQQSLAEMVMGKSIRVISRAVDDYGRTVADLSIDEINVNYEQVRRGMAWETSRYHSNKELVALQREAQQAKRGLWAETDAIAPAQWRKQHPTHDKTHLAPNLAPNPALNPACNKKRCIDMSSCEQAKHYLALCGIKTLDADNDGVPCEKLCAPKPEK